MRVFIYEYICGGGLAGQPLPDSLACEGWAMLHSVVEDFARIDGCEVVTTLDERFSQRSLAAKVVDIIRDDREPAPSSVSHRLRALGCERIARRSAESDWTLVIAPEFAGILFHCVRSIEEIGGRLLGPSSMAVAVTADKFRCARHLADSGVPVVETHLVQLDELQPNRFPVQFPAVLKPRDGAGSQNTFLIRDPAAFDHVVRNAKAGGLCGEALLQPFVPGLAASVSLLVGPHGPLPLLAGEQRLSTDGRFQYVGGRMPLAPDLSERAIALACRAAATIPGLHGFVGVDLIVGLARGEAAIAGCRHGVACAQNSVTRTKYSVVRDATSDAGDDSALDVIVEINPRLTTSYVGLRSLAIDNIAERMIAVVAGKCRSPFRWQCGEVEFAADGRLT
jgi:hypothetical protein